MPWCIPLPSFLRLPSPSTPPRPRHPNPAKDAQDQNQKNSYERGTMQRAGRDETVDGDGASESGTFYIVPNKYGPGKKIVRRPRPPPTSAPLDDDFDAITQGGTTMRGVGGGGNRTPTEWGTHVHGARTAIPLDDDFDAITYTVAGGPPGETPTEVESEWTQRSPQRGPPPNRSLPNRSPVRNPPVQERPRSSEPPRGNSGKFSASGNGNVFRQERSGVVPEGSGAENYGEYGPYINEMEKTFAKSVEQDLTLKRVSQDQERGENRQIGRVKGIGTGALDKRENSWKGTPPRISNPTRLGPPVNNRTPIVGPKPGQNYEVVNRRVIEDGPERTVTISTWREQVAREAGDSEMSVYYVGADDYASESGNGEEEREPSRIDRAPLGERRGSGTGSNPGIRNGLKALGPGQASPERRMSPPRHSSSGAYQNRSDEVKLNNFGHRSDSPQSLSQTQYSGVNAPHFDNNGSSKQGSYRADHSPPRTSTPVRTPPARMPTPLSPTRAKMLPPEPFHPTQSGSTISSIKTASTIAFEHVLSSCEPSLLHIAPVLGSLGITREEHLRAVARLTEDIRDRQVKEEALRQGVTIMEWAILLDKLQTL